MKNKTNQCHKINKAVFCLEQARAVTMNRFCLKQGQCSKEPKAQLYSNFPGVSLPGKQATKSQTKYSTVTFHAKTCYNSFPFLNGIPFRTRLKEICIRSNDLGHLFKKICIRSNGLITRSIETSSRSNDLLTRLVKASICSNDLLTRSIKTSNRSIDLLTRLLKTSNRLNDLLTRSLEHPSVQTT